MRRPQPVQSALGAPRRPAGSGACPRSELTQGAPRATARADQGPVDRRAGSPRSAPATGSAGPRRLPFAGWLAPLAAAALLLAPTGCLSPDEHAAQADFEAYALIASRREAIGTDPKAFTIEPYYSPALERLAEETRQFRRGEREQPPTIRLIEAIELAAALDGGWQDRRERLYLAALDVTLERWRLGYVPRGGGAGGVAGADGEAGSVDAGFSTGFTKLFSSGGRLLFDVGADLFDSLLSSDGESLTTNLQLSFTQPLLAGAGERVTLEALTQAERDLLYEARSYERFQRTFAYQIADNYYSILLASDFLKNEEANYESLTKVATRNAALVEAGRLSDIQMDQARQDEFRARNRVIDTRQSLENQLDRFRETLGLPITAPLQLDQGELDRLAAAADGAAAIGPAEAVMLALERRLDLKNAYGRLEDARRRVDITRNLLGAVVDVVAGAGSQSATQSPFDYGDSELDWNLGLDVDSTLDRRLQRNSYRSAIISQRASERSALDLADSIRVAVRDALRQETTRRQAFEIQKQAVELSLRRVESAELNLQAGNAQTRDLLESQAALVQAQNARTSALIDYRLAQLALLRDTELLGLDGDGFVALSPEDSPAAGMTLAGLEPGAPWGLAPQATAASGAEPVLAEALGSDGETSAATGDPPGAAAGPATLSESADSERLDL